MTNKPLQALSLLLLPLFLFAACGAKETAAPQDWEAQYHSLREEYDALQEDYKAALDEHARLQAEYDAILEDHTHLFSQRVLFLTTPLNPNYDYWDTVLFAPKDTACYAQHTRESAIVKTVSDCLVKVLFSVYAESESWSMVFIPSVDTLTDSLVWIPTAQLLIYEPESMEDSLTYPVKIRPGVELVDNEFGESMGESGNAWAHIASRQEGYVRIQLAGGRSVDIPLEDILFPVVQDGEILWE